jgi:large subunit ribosomal protein L1
LVEQVKSGQINFDKCVATPDMMAMLGAVAKVLGPKGMMPNPKLGTVTMNVADAIKQLKSGQVEFKVDKGGIIHAGFGKASFSLLDLKTNLLALVSAVVKAKPSGAKGTYMKGVYLSSTMGVGVKLEISDVLSVIS